MDANVLRYLGLAIAFAGLLVIVGAALLLIFSRAKTERNVEGGGAILIGPIPIVFGTNKKIIRDVMLLSIALTVLLIIFIVASYLASR